MSNANTTHNSKNNSSPNSEINTLNSEIRKTSLLKKAGSISKPKNEGKEGKKD